MFIGFITKNKKDPLYSSNYYYMNILDIETMMIGSIPFILIILFNLSLIYSIIVLLYPILYPTIITYPWTSLLEDDNENDKTTKQKKRNNDPWLLLTSFFSLFNHNHNNKNQTVVLAGSFNPPHLGHLAVLLYLSSRQVMFFFLRIIILIYSSRSLDRDHFLLRDIFFVTNIYIIEIRIHFIPPVCILMTLFCKSLICGIFFFLLLLF